MTFGDATEGPATDGRLFIDPLRHRCLPSNDAEQIERTLTIEVHAGHLIWVLTGDTAAACRAKQVGLKAHLIESARA